MKTEKSINCPQCNSPIDVNEIVFHQLQEEIQKDFDKKSLKREEEIEKQLADVAAEKKKIESDKEQLSELVTAQVQSKLKSEKGKLEKSIREKLQEESSDQLKDLQKELEEKSSQLRDLNKTKAEVERLKREKDELSDKITLEKETEFSEKLKGEKQKIKTLADEENFLQIKELQKQLEVQKELAEEAVRKAKQGSMQSAGEIQEIVIENMLRELYVFDEITEIKKGQKGADALQQVKTQQGVCAGKIYFESKRTKKWEHGWIKKLKNDNLEIKADILVIVTQVMPDGHEKFCLIDGVFICSLWEVKALSMVLRYGLLQVHAVSVTQNGKEGKMERLYSYLTGQEFSGTFSAIIEGFKSLQDSHADEKLKMQRIWKTREKELEKILSSAVEFYGTLKGIGGASIAEVKMLEDAKEPAIDSSKEK